MKSTNPREDGSRGRDASAGPRTGAERHSRGEESGSLPERGMTATGGPEEISWLTKRSSNGLHGHRPKML